ncbi:MAG TPA: tetratricopeptide repeat protein [Bryobacteraceae bacterium]|nr:tetratricopeptide repeat protein [Bryobacteraceae bacterium]
MLRDWRLAGIILGTLALTAYGRAETGYARPEVCAGCHGSVWETYRRTGMARSFYQPSSTNMVEDFSNKNSFYHKPSDSYFRMLQRDGRYYQRRYQIDSTGKQANVMEKQIDFVLGSGNHARAYLHRTARGTLVELPLAWYAEKGGYWAMNPGYDRPDHDGFRRPITYACMFCHNGYPRIPAGHDQPFAEPVYMGSLPEGIDCQRCHGPGRKHAQLASTAGASLKDLRASIVNPSRLSPQRQMELCMACHLETTSFPLPNALQRYERGPFSYQPGEPLGSFILNFDHAPGKGRSDKFELVSAAYRLRRSACFLKSNGALRCTTCHNPHDIPRGEEAAQHYTNVCRQCHASAFNQLVESGRHSRSVDCIGCHMPKRRTEDVVHAVVTDHYIQRSRPTEDLLAEMPERHETGGTAYRGPVALYYPEELPRTPENDLLLAIAQVNEKSNLTHGIAQLSAAIERHPPARAEYYFELAEAWRDKGELAKALPLYNESIRRNPNFVFGLQRLGSGLRSSGEYAESTEFLKRAASVEPDNPSTWLELGLTYRALDNKLQAVAAFEKAAELDPDMPEAHNNLGIVWFSDGEQARAESAFREAIRIQPNYADAHGNLGTLLSGTGALSESLYHFEIAIRLRPDDAATRYNYAVALGRTRHFDEAQRELEAALRADPKLADAHELLGDMLMAKGQPQAALPHYREAVRIEPEFGRAHLGLASALAAVGDVADAIPHLQKASADSDSAVREEAARMLRQLQKEQ